MSAKPPAIGGSFLAPSVCLILGLTGCGDPQTTSAPVDPASPDEPGPVITLSPGNGAPGQSVTLDSQVPEEREAVARMKRLLEETVLPSVEFHDTPLPDALEWLQMRFVELTDEPGPARRGISIIPESAIPENIGVAPEDSEPSGFGADPPAAGPYPGINLHLENVSFDEALRYTTAFAGMTYRVEPHGLVVVPGGEPYPSATLTTTTYRVAPDFATHLRKPVPEAPAPFQPEPEEETKTTSISPQNFLESAGISFASGTYAYFDAGANTLEVRNSEDQMELVEAFLQSLQR